MIALDYDFTVEGVNHDLTRLIDRYLQRGKRTLGRAAKFHNVAWAKDDYEALVQDAARDLWAAWRVGALADRGRG